MDEDSETSSAGVSPKNIQHLMEFHTALSDVAQSANETYSAHVLFTCITLLFNTYFNVLTVLHQDRGFYHDAFWSYKSLSPSPLCGLMIQSDVLVYSMNREGFNKQKLSLA